MVPNIARNGKSFRGAGAYHLHDKVQEGVEKLTTAKRVAWTATRNLAHEDAEQALDEMWRTAEDAAHLKRMSGKAASGRTSDAPVKTMSLSWAPHQSPTRRDMEAAADSFLKSMGWQEHQAVLVAHNDEPHPHLHIILNRVHPDTGLTLNDWQERKRAQRWALGYEREEGQILCFARVDKYEKGRDLAPSGMPYPYAKLIDEHERAFDNPLTEAAVLDRLEKDMLAERHREEREAFLASGKAQFREARQTAYREVRDEFKPLWREHFAEQREALQDIEAQIRQLHRQAVKIAREGDHEGAGQVLAALDEHRDSVRDWLASDRADLRERQLDTTRERQDLACRDVIALRAVAFDEIKDRQKDERAELKDLQAARDAGQPYDIDRLQELIGDKELQPAANDNRSAEELFEAAKNDAHGGGAFLAEALPHDSGSPLFQSVLQSTPAEPGERAEPGPRRDAVDLVTGGIAGAISLGITLLEGFVSSPSPLEQAQAKARAIRKAEEAPKIAAQLREEKLRDDFTRHALTAVREAHAEQECERKLDHEERGRSRERER